MNPDSRNSIDAARLATAWDWVLRMRDENASQEELAGWLNWYEADERNKQAFEEMQSFWRQSPRVADEPRPLPRELWRADATRGRQLRRYRYGIAAALAAGLAVAVIAPRYWTQAQPVTVVAVAAPQQPVTATALPDGSSVQLAEKSAISLEYSKTERRLVLQEGGVAHFKVAHNRDRPFIVRAGPVYVRAVGTEFNVRNAGDRVVVTVQEGAVDVYPAVQSGTDRVPVRLEAGKEITWVAWSTGPTIAAVDPQRALSWREGRLDYFNEPLSSVVVDLNRYSPRRIVIRDEAVGQIVISGTVLTNNTDDWIRSLPGVFPLQVLDGADGSLVLALRPAS